MSPLGLCYHVAGGTSQVRRAVNARCGVTGGARGVATGAGLLLSIEVDNVSRCNQYFMNGCMIPSLYKYMILLRESATPSETLTSVVINSSRGSGAEGAVLLEALMCKYAPAKCINYSCSEGGAGRRAQREAAMVLM